MRSRLGAGLWLFATILVGSWGAAAGSEGRAEPLSVDQEAGSLTPEPARPSLLPRGLPRVVASESHRQKPSRAHDGTSFGTLPEGAPSPLVTDQGLPPILRGDLPRPAPVRAFEPRGPPLLIA